jgi:hypothetical protein
MRRLTCVYPLLLAGLLIGWQAGEKENGLTPAKGQTVVFPWPGSQKGIRLRMQSTTRPLAGQASPFVSRAETPPPPRSKPWHGRIPVGWHRTCGLTRRQACGLLVIEETCRDKCYSWHRNKKLCELLGIGERALAYLLRDLERLGWIYCVPKTTGRPGRLAIVLLRRADMDLPVAMIEDVPGIVEAIARARERRTGQGRLPLTEPPVVPASSCTLDLQVPAPSMPASSCTPEELLFSEKDEVEKESPSSSLTAKPSAEPEPKPAEDDDATSSVSPSQEEKSPEAEPEGLAEAVATFRTLFGDDQAEALKADASDVGPKIQGRWDAFAVAAYKTASVAKRKEIDTRIGYTVTVLQGWKGNPPKEAELLRKTFKDKATWRASLDAEIAKATEQAEREAAADAENQNKVQELLQRLEAHGFQLMATPRHELLPHTLAGGLAHRDDIAPGDADEIKALKRDILIYLASRPIPPITDPTPTPRAQAQAKENEAKLAEFRRGLTNPRRGLTNMDF